MDLRGHNYLIRGLHNFHAFIILLLLFRALQVVVTDNFNFSRKRLHICHFSSIFLHRLFPSSSSLSSPLFPLPDQSGSDGEFRFGVPLVYLALASRVLLNVLQRLGSGPQNRTHNRVRHLGRKELFFRELTKMGQEKANGEL